MEEGNERKCCTGREREKETKGKKKRKKMDWGKREGIFEDTEKVRCR